MKICALSRRVWFFGGFPSFREFVDAIVSAIDGRATTRCRTNLCSRFRLSPEKADFDVIADIVELDERFP